MWINSRGPYHPHFTDEETEAQRGRSHCPWAHRQGVQRLSPEVVLWLVLLLEGHFGACLAVTRPYCHFSGFIL